MQNISFVLNRYLLIIKQVYKSEYVYQDTNNFVTTVRIHHERLKLKFMQELNGVQELT